MSAQNVAFTFASLSELDNGVVAREMDAELRRVGLDCYERPGDDRTRKVNLQIELKPRADLTGALEDVAITFQTKSTIPTRTTTTYKARGKKTGQLVFTEFYPSEGETE